MKKLSTFILCILVLGTLSAQIRLDVEGDAKIRGKLDLKMGTNSLVIGENAGNAGSGDTFVGINAGSSNTSGGDNSFFGLNAGADNKDGYNNSFFGMEAGTDNIYGRNNSFFGMRAGSSNISGIENVFFGLGAGSNNTSGSHNAFFGMAAGLQYNNSRSTMLGRSAETMDSLDRAIAIGYRAKVACHNCAVIGGTGDNAVKVGIGTDSPINPMHIVQTDGFDSDKGIRLELADGSKYWTTFGDANGRYNITHDGKYLAFIDPLGNYNVATNPFTSQDDSSKSRSSTTQSMDKVLDKVKKLQPATKKLSAGRNARKIWGFVPEEVAELFPEITPETDGRTSIIYDYFGILSIKAIQELATELDVQTQEKEDLKEVVEDQQGQINELKSLVGKLLTQNAITPKSTSYVLPLEQEALLAQNQPNPFRENTLVDYFVPAEVQNAHIQVTNMDGQVLGQVKITEKGKGQVTIQSKSYSAGTYFYSLVLDGQVMETKRMVLAK